MVNQKESIYQVTTKIIHSLYQQVEYSTGKARLANLRYSIGKSYGDTSAVWPILFEHLPESFLGKTKELSLEEKAILTTLQLYALHQQGRTENMHTYPSNQKSYNLGSTFNEIRVIGDSVALDRRFNTMITADTFEELTHHLRQLIKLLKSKSNQKVDYGQLGQDLYWYLRGYKDNMKISWSRSYYYSQYNQEEK